MFSVSYWCLANCNWSQVRKLSASVPHQHTLQKVPPAPGWAIYSICSNPRLDKWMWIIAICIYKGHFTVHTRAKSCESVTMILWEPKRKCPKVVPTHLPKHLVWSQILKCGVKSYVTRSSTNSYFNEFLLMWVLNHDKLENQWLCVFGVPYMVSRLCVKPTSKRWFMKIVQVTMKHDPFDVM